MITDAFNQVRSLYVPAAKVAGNGLSTLIGSGFLDALDAELPKSSATQQIDGLPYEKDSKKSGNPISDLPETPEEPVDPQILLTQKLAETMMRNLLNGQISDKPVVPVDLARPT